MSLQNSTNRFPSSFYDLNDLPGELQRRPVVVFRQNTPVSHTGDLLETTLLSQAIQPNEYSENAVFEIYGLFSMSNTAGKKNFFVKINNTPISVIVPATPRQSLQINKLLFNRGSKQSQLSSPLASEGSWGSSANPNTAFSINLSTAFQLSITTRLEVATDMATLESAFLRVTY